MVHAAGHVSRSNGALGLQSLIGKGSSLPDQTSHLNFSHISGVICGLSLMEKILSREREHVSTVVQ